MATMEICSNLKDQQTSKMHEASMLAYKVRKASRNVRLGFRKPKRSPGGSGGAKAFPLGGKEISLDANRPSVLLAHGSNEALNAPLTHLSENLFSKGKCAVAAPEDPATTSAWNRCQAPSTQAASTRSDGEASEERLQRPPPPSSHREVSTQSSKEAAGAPGYLSHTQVLPKISTPLSRIPELFSVVAGKGQSSEHRGSTAERQVARGGSPPKESDPSKRPVSKGRPSISLATPPNAALTTHPSNGPGPTAPTGADP
ncbi:unnamed protein product [Sphagnum jensenii]|uniref:Uncharacterized protein n=1 Tax=Sphagnum jensenii TaxID=128206 RepID=A0ABP1AYL0_9BRYO